MSTRIISLRLSDDAIREADRLAKEQGLSRSKLVENLLLNSIDRMATSKDVEHIRAYVEKPYPFRRRGA